MSGEREVQAIFPRRLKYLAAIVSIICAILIIIHAIYPQYSIDTTTIALIIILIFPWLLPYIRTLKLPGGTEVTFKEEVRELERLSARSPISSAADRAPIVPSRLQLLTVDPNLALASLRIEIERKLRDIARQRNLRVASERVSLRRVLNTLHSEKIIATREFKILNVIIDICNRAVHAEKVETTTASEILDIGESALLYLDSIMVPRETPE